MNFKKLLNKTNPTILEIGCANGDDSLRFLKDFEDVKLFCFEPDKRGIQKFKTKIQDKRCTLIESAVGNEDGLTEFYVSSGTAPKLENYGDWDLSSSIKMPKDHLINHPWCSFNKIQNVSITKLDTWTEKSKIEHIDLIWADVQGAEKELILGGQKTLSKTEYFYTEYSTTEEYEGAINAQEILRLLPNFYIIQIMTYDVLFRNRRYNNV